MTDTVKLDFIHGQNCFFIFPTIVITDYRKDNWISEIKTIMFYWGRYYYKWEIIKTTKETNYSVNSDLLKIVVKVLNKYNHVITNMEKLKDYLIENKNVVLMIKNCPQEHKYFTETLFNILRFNDFVKEKHIEEISSSKTAKSNMSMKNEVRLNVN